MMFFFGGHVFEISLMVEDNYYLLSGAEERVFGNFQGQGEFGEFSLEYAIFVLFSKLFVGEVFFIVTPYYTSTEVLLFSICELSLHTIVWIFDVLRALIDCIAFPSSSGMIGVAKLRLRRSGVDGSGCCMLENLLKMSVYLDAKKTWNGSLRECRRVPFACGNKC